MFRMALFGRRKKKSQHELRDDEWVLIPPDEVERLIDRLTAMVVEGMAEFPFTEETLGLLQVGLPYLTQRECSRDAVQAGQTAARLGYLARSAEFAQFDDAREADLDLLKALEGPLEKADERGSSTSDVLAEFAATIAREPGDLALPGIGPDMRGRLRAHLLRGLELPADLDVTVDELQETWDYGYFLRGLEEFFFEDGMQH